MAISDLLNRRVRAHADDEDEEVSEASASAGPEDEQDDDSEADSNGDEDPGEGSEDMDNSDEASDSDNDSDGDGDIQSSINNISFGALAKAQSSLPKKQKQKHTTQQDESTEDQPSPLDDIRARIYEAREQKRQSQAQAQTTKPSKPSKTSKTSEDKKRTSKHAPMVQSSKHAVTRRRTVIEPPAVPRTRDPRFDPTVVGKHGRMDPAASDSAYAFLNEYRASELRDLKEQLKTTKNAEQKEELKRAVRSATDRMRETENRKREQSILADHKKSEKELIREGKKSNPYYMKKSDLKKEVLLRKYNEMNSKDRAKALERRRKKMTSKERLQMPAERRGLDSGPPEDARKRKRTE